MKVILALIIIGVYLSKKVAYVGNPIVENCVACKFIWENIEEAMVNNNFLESKRNPILAAQAFQYFCKISPDIFYEPCNIMFEKLFFMTQDFCARKRIIEVCINSELCPKES
jgi:hypothetical protein